LWGRSHKKQHALTASRSRVKRTYGITAEEKAIKFEKQGRKCASCRSSKVGYYPKKRKMINPWCVDHNHTTKQIRGILCHPCNFTIGNAKESVERLRACADYLEKYK
jgi:hypothetical protein